MSAIKKINVNGEEYELGTVKTVNGNAPDEDGNVEVLGGSGLTEAVKSALLNCFAHVAWVDEHGQSYYGELEQALYGGTPEKTLVSIVENGETDYEWYLQCNDFVEQVSIEKKDGVLAFVTENGSKYNNLFFGLIDLTYINTLYLNYNAENIYIANYSGTLLVSSTLNKNKPSVNFTQFNNGTDVTVSLDVSNITGEQYVGVGFEGMQRQSQYVEIIRLWGE